MGVDVDLPEYREGAIEGATFLDANLANPYDARMVLDGMATVFHLAADMGGVGYFHSDADLGASMTNGQITLNVLHCAQLVGVERLFYSSSACAYPIEFQQNPLVAPKLSEDWLGMGTPTPCTAPRNCTGCASVRRCLPPASACCTPCSARCRSTRADG